jgi:uncharacterized membrane protein
MKNRILLLLGLLAAALLQIGYYYQHLPERVASHFGADGRPNDWMARWSFVAIYIGMMAFLTFIFIAVPKCIRTIPRGLINLPNKDYWLSPEHVDETIEIFGALMAEFGSATLLLLIVVFHLAFQANIEGGNLDTAVAWVSIGAYLMFSIFWTIRLYRAFRLPVTPPRG